MDFGPLGEGLRITLEEILAPCIEQLAGPCEVQLFAFFPRLEASSVLVGTALCTGAGRLVCFTPRERAWILVDPPTERKLKHYLYVVLRRIDPTTRAAIEYVYIMPPTGIYVASVGDAAGAQQLLDLEEQIPVFADVYFAGGG